MVKLGELKPYDLREIWKYEDRHFTVWLCENLERLGSALGMELQLKEREKAVGPFSADILAFDTRRERHVVIENQLEQTDHDHFGKLLTYAAGLEASAIIWISPLFRDQHRAALDWLNSHTDDALEFFGVSLEAVQIDDSRPALNFKVVASPNTWQKSFISQRTDGGLDGRTAYFYEFNESLANILRQGTTFQPPIPTPRYEVNIQRSHGGILYMTILSRNVLKATLSISFVDPDMNRRVFEKLRSSAPDIERAIGCGLDWDFAADRRRQLISVIRNDVTRESSQIPELATWAAQRLTDLKNAFEPRLPAVIAEATQMISSSSSHDVSLEN